jgi:DNA-binding XRE family transcriptional regulator
MVNITRDDFVKIRKMHGLSQNEMGHILGIKQAGVSRIEKGYNGITDENMKIINNYFDLTHGKLSMIRGMYDLFMAGNTRD